ncbi:AmmeMemoRadiSam system radical SAM enzyme [Rhodospirillum rubrum]|uniref:Radical SAM n=1 Tax=Rhodospirillum rubrum (strain ATCC 11170 / ATH 1.1.1 / DSM 467 / LMG 4362 / NCIMB 8255 / S1) TaxID=269796 RepID=Q2RX91_RHORT|nr:AmmeMemoRadiSam system radical SAM enzyme [Rhodospirillum rubrum]ABC21254.1 Radical SAM [Rhodospirillum rubrum ATCC 11170]AEO46929.1 radical SAM family protein [Rhodospirillum rubrum F11]MBK5952807.1 AmmeMemoRadiSam system radical SAM enzyme [Rhodospirillum rubrum]QXG80939.1 AmmeMemoRadiSam system radical SAM enzyme [Rhodospirillum rubrum]HAP99980.1 AmmeMemoRadiSam system radical SAM enzyme [Rhodospirillum rubrum]
MDKDWGDAIRPARYWHRQGADHAVCDLCPRHCRLGPGQRGLCFVRANIEGVMVLTGAGRSSGFCVDPIEKKPLAHFLPGTPVLSFGGAGCNLTCAGCQNWRLSRARSMDRLGGTTSPRAIADLALGLGCRSVAFTYNDPVIACEEVIDVALACRDRGLRTVAVTAGYIDPAPARDFFAVMDAANVDLKAFREDGYRKLTSAHLGPVLETLRFLAGEAAVWLEITTLLIPGRNDGDEELADLVAFVAADLGREVPLHFTAFHPDHRLSALPATPAATLLRAREIARAAGLAHVYLGNLPAGALGGAEDGETTLCVGCGAPLIGRRGYAITGWALDDSGHCLGCGRALAGVIEGPPGTWGPRRLPVPGVASG